MAKRAALPETKVITDESEKDKALEAARLQIEKQFGKGSLDEAWEPEQILNVESIPSGIYTS